MSWEKAQGDKSRLPECCQGAPERGITLQGRGAADPSVSHTLMLSWRSLEVKAERRRNTSLLPSAKPSPPCWDCRQGPQVGIPAPLSSLQVHDRFPLQPSPHQYSHVWTLLSAVLHSVASASRSSRESGEEAIMFPRGPWAQEGVCVIDPVLLSFYVAF